MLAATAILFVLLVALGVPIALVFLAITGFWIVFEPAVMDVAVIQRIVSGTQSFPLLAVPLFILAGELMNVSGITGRVMRFAMLLTRNLTGGLAKTNVLLSMLLSGMSGSANGDPAMQSRILVPHMTERGYPGPFSAALTASSALISPLIPPGISLILFGFVTNTSIGALFLGAMLPGLLLTLMLLGQVHLASRDAGWDRDLTEEPEPVGPAFVGALPALAMPILVILGIRGGVFTPSEAGGVAVAYTLLFAAIYRETSIPELVEALHSTIVTSAAILLVLASSSAFTWVLTFEGVPQMVGQSLLSVADGPVVMLLLIAAILLVCGMIVEGTALILVLAPMFMPVARCHRGAGRRVRPCDPAVPPDLPDYGARLDPLSADLDPSARTLTLPRSVKPMTEKARSDGYTAPAVDKALDVLEALAAQPAGASTSELSRALGRSVGEIYRVVLTLERRHYIAKEPDTDRFYLTLRLFELAHRHPPTLRLVRAAQPILDEIAAETLQSCHLVVAQGDEAIIIAGADSPMPMRYGVRVGARFPLFETSSGVVIAAFGSDRARRDAGGEEALASYGERIERIRSLGYEVWDSQVVRGVTNLATPVLDHAGRSCAALTVPYLEQLRATPTRKDVLERLVLEARRLSWTMGHDGETVAEPQDQGDQLRKATP